jgi:glycosyltransferase involved in cell wall biosynthesis
MALYRQIATVTKDVQTHTVVEDHPQKGQGALVSVIIPTYNRVKLLPRALDSVFTQTYRPIELIVVDDGSTDNTKDVVLAFKKVTAHDDQFYFVYIPQKNSGSQSARNRGLQEARGNYIRFIDSDDELFPDATRSQVETMKNSRAVVSYGDWEEKSDAQVAHLNRQGVFSARDILDPIGDLLGDKWCPNFCYLINKEVVVNVGGWDGSYKALQDRDFIQRIAYTGNEFVHVNCNIGCYHQHSGDRVSRRDKLVWLSYMKKTIYDGIAWIDQHSAWTEVRRRKIARSLFQHARRYHQIEKSEFHEIISTIKKIHPAFRPPGILYPLVAKIVGYDGAETIRNHAKKLLRRN